MPRIRLIAGPNGAGKTTLMKTLVKNKVPVGQYINPDDIARHINLNIFEKEFDKANPTWFIEHLLMKWPKENVRIATI